MIPVEYRAKTRHNHYSNYIDLINLDDYPVSVHRCDVGNIDFFCNSKILADIQQPPDSLQDAISLWNPLSNASLTSLDVGKVIEGGVSVSAIRIQNERPYSILLDCNSSEESVFVCFVGDDGDDDEHNKHENGDEYDGDIGEGGTESGKGNAGMNLSGLQMNPKKQGKKTDMKNNRIVVGS